MAHDADCHQFMLYTPVPGTPLHAEMEAQGRMLEGVDLADIHGQYKFNFRHEHIERDDSKVWLDWAFQHDFDVNGPSLFRMMRTMFEGWKRYGADRDARVRARFAGEAAKLRQGYGAALWAMERYLAASNERVSERIGDLRRQIEQRTRRPVLYHRPRGRPGAVVVGAAGRGGVPDRAASGTADLCGPQALVNHRQDFSTPAYGHMTAYSGAITNPHLNPIDPDKWGVLGKRECARLGPAATFR